MNLVIQIATIFIIAVIALIAYNSIKRFIFTKVKPNKWIVLVLLIITFFIPLIWPLVYKSFITTAIFFVLITIFALTFVDILKFEKAEKNKPVVGKPKAKPNRANKKDD